VTVPFLLLVNSYKSKIISITDTKYVLSKLNIRLSKLHFLSLTMQETKIRWLVQIRILTILAKIFTYAYIIKYKGYVLFQP